MANKQIHELDPNPDEFSNIAIASQRDTGSQNWQTEQISLLQIRQYLSAFFEYANAVADHLMEDDPHFQYFLRSDTIPDNRIPASITRDTELTSAISTHNADSNAHGGGLGGGGTGIPSGISFTFNSGGTATTATGEVRCPGGDLANPTHPTVPPWLTFSLTDSQGNAAQNLLQRLKTNTILTLKADKDNWVRYRVTADFITSSPVPSYTEIEVQESHGAIASGTTVWLDILVTGITDSDIPNSIARDAEVTSAIASAITTHEAQSDPHAQYYKSGETINDSDIPGTIARDTEVTSAIASAITAHEAASNPHPQYSGGGGGGLPSRTTAAFTSSSLAVNATATGTINIAKSFTLVSVQVSAKARLRLYQTTATRDADLSRLETTPPEGQHGLITDMIPDLSARPNYGRVGNNCESSPTAAIAYSLTNRSTSTAAITVTITYIPLEA